MHKKNRFFYILMSFTLVVNTIYFNKLTVRADDLFQGDIEYAEYFPDEWTEEDFWYYWYHISVAGLQGLCGDLFGALETAWNYGEFAGFFESGDDGKVNILNDAVTWDEDAGTVTASDALMDKLKEILDENINSQSGGNVTTGDYGDYYILPTFSYQELWEKVNYLSDNNTNYWLVNSRNVLLDKTNSYNALILRISSSSYYRALRIIPFDVSQNYVGSCNTSYAVARVYDDTANRLTLNLTETLIQYNSATSEPSTSQIDFSDTLYLNHGTDYEVIDMDGYTLVTRTGENIRVWKSAAKLSQFLTGTGTTSNYAITSNYINYDNSIDNSYTTNIQTINNIQNNYNSYLNEINETINNINNYNTSNVTYNEYQTYVDNSVTNIINNYYYGDDTGGSGDGSVSDNSPTLDSDAFYDEEGKSWFEKIHTRLEEILDKLKEIKRWLVGDVIMDGVGSLAELFLDLKDGIQDMVDNMTDLIPDIGDLAEDLVEIGEDKITDIVTDVGDTFAPTGALLKTRFPFCIPWDLIAIATVLVAPAKPPVYEIPFVIESIGFEHTVILDMSVWEPVAGLCRTMLTLIFILILIHITIKLTSKGDNEE